MSIPQKRSYPTLFILFVIAVGALSILTVAESVVVSKQRVQVTFGNGAVVTAERAQSDVEKMQGLSGRASLPEGEGMLFVYDEPQRRSFWMKGMRFSLDFIWMHDGRVVEVTHDVPYPMGADDVVATIAPDAPASWVLEVPAGWAERSNIRAGETYAARAF